MSLPAIPGEVERLHVADPADCSVVALPKARLFVAEPEGAAAVAATPLFVHGGYHGAWCFARYMAHFRPAGVRSAALDLRGHGGLPRPEGFAAAGAAAMADDVVAARDALGGEVVLIGHSLGAIAAAMAAARTRVAGLGLLAPSPPGAIPGAQPVAPIPEGAPVPPPPAAVVRRRFLGGRGPADIDAYLARLTPESPAWLNDRYQLRVRVDRDRIAGPALCVGAGRDTPARHPPGQDRAVARFFGADYHLLPEAAHCFMLKADWRRSANLILRWLAAHFPPADTKT